MPSLVGSEMCIRDSHETLQAPVELGKELLVGLGEVHVPQIQPGLREISQEAVEALVLEQALGFLSQGTRILLQFALIGQAEQFPLRQGTIEEKGQAVRESQIIEASRFFTQVEEVRGREQGREDRPQGDLETFLFFALLLKKREVRTKVFICLLYTSPSPRD